jgi:hypothetical protein
VVEVNKRIIVAPKFLMELFASDQLARVLEEHGQNLKGLFLQPDFAAVLEQLTRSQVRLEDPELHQL